jgi:hypothetical protein
MSTPHFRKPGRHAARLGLIAGLALSTTALATGAARAEPVPLPWLVNYHNFGFVTSAYAFVFTNRGAVPVAGVPAPIQHTEFQVTANTCTTAVAPGGTCQVTVGYTADGQPIADQLQMHFTSPRGRPVAVPPVQLFAGGVTYVYTSHQNGAFVFPAAAAAGSRAVGQGTRALTPGGQVTVPYKPSGPGDVIDGPGPPIKWVKVVRNTCTVPIGRPKNCAVTLQAAPNTGGLRTANFQMSFENAQTGASVPVQDVTLIQPAG